MNLNNFEVILAQAPAPATSAATTTPAAPASTTAAQQGPPAYFQVVPIVLMMVVAYFILIRPQSKKAKQQAELLKTLKPGDKVVTSGGVVGVIVSVKENTVALRSVEAKMEVLKSAVSEITERAGETAAVEAN